MAENEEGVQEVVPESTELKEEVKENMYRFVKKDPEKGEIEELIKESELTTEQYNVIYSQLVNQFMNSPEKVQIAFVQFMLEHLKMKKETFTQQVNRIKKDINKKK